jgi:D-alanine-D-alanine ligase
MLGIPYTGSGVETLAITLDKAMTKRLLGYYHLPTPRFDELKTSDQRLATKLKFPLFVKPNSEGTGVGISDKSIVKNNKQLRERVKYLLKAYGRSVLVEKYINGFDATVGMVGNWPDLHIFPISIIDKTTYKAVGEKVYGSEMKVDQADKYKYLCPAPLPKVLERKLKEIAVKVMRVTNTLDFGRVDFRIDSKNRPYVLEINSLPGITPISDMTLMAEAEGWTHSELVNSVLETAVKRLNIK